jgi:hypothetical protein
MCSSKRKGLELPLHSFIAQFLEPDIIPGSRQKSGSLIFSASAFTHSSSGGASAPQLICFFCHT